MNEDLSVDAISDLIVRGNAEGVAVALQAAPTLLAARTVEGDMLLHVACWQKQVAIVSTLLADGADVNAHGWLGRTPLHYAVHEGRRISVPIVKLLMDFGADPALKDDNGFTVADWARIEMYECLDQVLDLIRAHRDSP